MGTFQKREPQFQAEQFTGPDSIQGILDMCRIGTVTVTYQTFIFEESTLTLKMTSGPDIVLHDGDWLCSSTDCKPPYHVFKDDEFTKQYREAYQARLPLQSSGGNGRIVAFGGGGGGAYWGDSNVVSK